MSSYDKELAAVFQKHEVVFNKNRNCDHRYDFKKRTPCL